MHDKHMARHADIMKRAGEHEAKAAATKSELDLTAGQLKTAHAESAKHVQAIADLKKSGDSELSCQPLAASAASPGRGRTYLCNIYFYQIE